MEFRLTLSVSPIRVLRLIARMNVGGPAIQITGLMSNLSTEEFKQRLITGFCDQNEVDYLEVKDLKLPCIKIEGFGRSVNLLYDLKVLLAIRKQIRIFNPHIIHTHTSKAGFLGRIAAILSL